MAAAKAAVPDGFVVEVSKDTDAGRVRWEVKVRVGDSARELTINGADGSVLRNERDSLSRGQGGSLPAVTALQAIATAEKQVSEGEIDDVELTIERNQRIWDVSIEVPRARDWEVWIDAESRDVLRKQRD